MKFSLAPLILSAAICNGFTANVMAAEHQVLMLNSNASGVMVFEPALTHVAVGDTVKFISKNVGHNAESVEGLIPNGATPFKGDINSTFVATIDKEGVYVVQCFPHAMMAMVSVIVAGKPTNLSEIKDKAVSYSSKFVMNKNRLNNILAEIK